MKNETKHTPTPWMVESLQAGHVVLGDVIGQDESEYYADEVSA